MSQRSLWSFNISIIIFSLHPTTPVLHLVNSNAPVLHLVNSNAPVLHLVNSNAPVLHLVNSNAPFHIILSTPFSSFTLTVLLDFETLSLSSISHYLLQPSRNFFSGKHFLSTFNPHYTRARFLCCSCHLCLDNSSINFSTFDGNCS